MGVQKGRETRKAFCPLIKQDVTVELQYVEIVTRAGPQRKKYIGKECSNHETCYEQERECTLASRGTYDPLESIG